MKVSESSDVELIYLMNFIRVNLPEKVMKDARMDERYDDSLSFTYHVMFSPNCAGGRGWLQ